MAITNAGVADDVARQAKATADTAATTNVTQQAAILNAQNDATTAINQNSQQDTAIAANTAKVGVPAGGAAGQVLKRASGGGLEWAADNAGSVGLSSVRPDNLVGRTLDLHWQVESPSENFGTGYDFTDTDHNFPYGGGTGRIDRVQLDSNGRIQLRWFGFTKAQLAGLIVRLTSGTNPSVEFSADSGTDFVSRVSTYAAVNLPSGIATRPLDVRVIEPARDVAATGGDVVITGNGNTFTYAKREEIVSQSTAVRDLRTDVRAADTKAQGAVDKNTEQDAAIALNTAKTGLPAGGSDGQFLGRASGAAAWVDAPSGGGGGTVSGTSGWGANLLATPIANAANGNAPLTSGNLANAGIVDLSGDVDSILVVVQGQGSGTAGTYSDSSVEIITPMTAANSHSCLYDRHQNIAGADANILEFSFPTIDGANSVIRFDTFGRGTPRIFGVYKKTRISGTPPVGGGGTEDTTARTAAAAAQTTADGAVSKNTEQDAAIALNTAKTGLPSGGSDGQILGRAGGAAAWQAPPPSSDQTARQAAAAADTKATNAQTTADGAVSANTRQDTAIAANTAKVGVPAGGTAGQVLKRAGGGGLEWGADANTDQTARDAAAAAQTDASQALTNASAASATATQAKTTADAAATKNTEQDAAIALNTAKVGVVGGGSAGQILSRTANGYAWIATPDAADETARTAAAAAQSSADSANTRSRANERKLQPYPSSLNSLGAGIPTVLVDDGEGVVRWQDATTLPTPSSVSASINRIRQIPSGGAEGQIVVLRNFSYRWADPPIGLPAGGSVGQVLEATGGTSPAHRWTDPSSFSAITAIRQLPTGGSAGQILSRTANGYQWIAAPTGGGGGGAGSVVNLGSSEGVGSSTLILPENWEDFYTIDVGFRSSTHASSRSLLVEFLKVFDSGDMFRFDSSYRLTWRKSLRRLQVSAGNSFRAASMMMAGGSSSGGGAGVDQTARDAASAAQTTADAATTPAEVRTLAATAVQNGVIGWALLANPSSKIPASKLAADVPTAAQVQSATDAATAAQTTADAATTPAEATTIAQTQVGSLIEDFAKKANTSSLIPASKVSGVATTGALAQVGGNVTILDGRVTAVETKNAQQDTAIAANRLPSGGTDGQILGRRGGAPAWVAPSAANVAQVSNDSIEPKHMRTRILELVLQREAPSENFSIYTFDETTSSFTYKGVTGRIDRVRLDTDGVLFEIRWFGFTKAQLAGLSVRITSNGAAQTFDADGGTDFSLRESDYPQVNTQGLTAHPLEIEVYIAEHRDDAVNGDIMVVNDGDSFEYQSPNAYATRIAKPYARLGSQDKIPAGELGNESVTFGNLAANSVHDGNLRNSSVTTDKIVDGAVTSDKLADGALTDAKIVSVSPDKVVLPDYGSGLWGAMS